MSKKAHKYTEFLLSITQFLVSLPRDWRGFLLGAPCCHRAAWLSQTSTALCSGWHSSKEMLYLKVFPKPLLLPTSVVPSECCRGAQSPHEFSEPSAHKLQHQIIEGTFLAGSSPSPQPISKLLALSGQWEKIKKNFKNQTKTKQNNAS